MRISRLEASFIHCAFGIGIAFLLANTAYAHGGGLNAEGCHNDRQNGGYHCHRSPAPSAPTPLFDADSNTGWSYLNCAAARAAGAAPVLFGEPGYGRHLDRDGDGVGCE